eukprot:SAG31_NODE_10923_length_1083_cov_0.853659_1_plen_116_part_10
MGAFTAGLVAATIGTNARYIEGAEMYTQNTDTDVARMRGWMKNGMAQSQFVVAANMNRTYPKCDHISQRVPPHALSSKCSVALRHDCPNTRAGWLCMPRCRLDIWPRRVRLPIDIQ